jgi:hypothetical protein
MQQRLSGRRPERLVISRAGGHQLPVRGGNPRFPPLSLLLGLRLLRRRRILAAAIAGDLHAEPDALAPRLAATTAVTGLRELYDTREARSLGPQPSGADLIQLVNQVIDYTIAGLAAVISCAP